MTKPAPLSSVSQPIAQAHGLPNAHYTDPQTFKEECDVLLFSGWSGIGVEADVPLNGDAKPIDFAGIPLLLLRDRDGEVRVFQNICRHRGMLLVQEPRRIEGVIRCPYHSWCYSTQGKLVSTPHVGGPGQNTVDGIDRNDLGLIEVRSRAWMGVVWINVSGDAPAFDDVHADMIQRWQEFDKPLYHGGAESTFTLDVACNWKLAVENYCESYHLPWIHPGLNTYSRLEDHYHIEAPDRYSGQGTHVYRQLEVDGNKFPDFEGLTDTWDTAAEYIAAYPNVLLGVHRDHVFALILMPQGPGHTQEHVHLFYPQAATNAALREQNAKQWKEVFEEDIFVVEGMQRGRQATGFDGGRFSPAMDGPTHLFHSWVAKRIDAQRNVAKAAE